jgi:hypothetical protein
VKKLPALYDALGKYMTTLFPRSQLKPKDVHLVGYPDPLHRPRARSARPSPASTPTSSRARSAATFHPAKVAQTAMTDEVWPSLAQALFPDGHHARKPTG